MTESMETTFKRGYFNALRHLEEDERDHNALVCALIQHAGGTLYVSKRAITFHKHSSYECEYDKYDDRYKLTIRESP